ncbi:hypothetical protein [Candidatus Hodgkinia cicadicola]|uniref:hypothetical protein n=1 Tax=Candidatus Hodgkinia cicadicola TaxID=573658 RepID=UPI001788AEA7
MKLNGSILNINSRKQLITTSMSFGILLIGINGSYKETNEHLSNKMKTHWSMA